MTATVPIAELDARFSAPDAVATVADHQDVAAFDGGCAAIRVCTVVPVVEAIVSEQRVEPADRRQVRGFAVARRLRHRVHGNAVVDPA